MARNSFVLSITYAEVFKEMSEEQAGALIKAIFDYESKMILPELTDAELKMAFKFIKRDLDYNKKKYEEICKKRAESGQKGGQTSKSKQMLEEEANGGKCLQMPPNASKSKHNDVVVEVDVDNDVENDNEKDVDVKGKEDCKGKNQRPLVDNSKSIMGESHKEQESNNGTNSPNDKTDFSFAGRQGTENDRTAKGTATGITMPKETKSQRSENLPATASEEGSIQASTSSDIISSTSVETFKARVEYAKSLGIEESVARRICNLAQSKKIALCEMHYKGFAGKSGKEVEQVFNLLKFLAKRGKNPSGLKHINSG